MKSAHQEKEPMSFQRKKINICHVDIDSISMKEALCIMEDIIAEKGRGLIVTPNVDHIVQLQKDEEFKVIYRQALLALPDGMPVMWGAKFLGTPLKQKISGSDLFPEFCKVTADKGYKMFFMGGRPGAVTRTKELLEKRYSKINIVGTYCPPFGFEKDEAENAKIVKMINQARPDVLFVGLGAPKQEKWLYRNYNELNVPVSAGIGITFEYMAGMVTRAPLWMQNVGLEWFWRLMMEPRRLWKRYLVYDMQFFWLILKQKFAMRKNRPVRE